MFLKKVPFPLPNPNIFNLDQILASTTDNVVSENGNFSHFFVFFSFIPRLSVMDSHNCFFLNNFSTTKFAALTFYDLGIAPHKLKGYPIEYLFSYREGGPQFGTTVSERVSPDSYP